MNALTPAGPLMLRPAPERDDITRWLDDLLALLRRRWKLIGLCLGVAVCAGAGYVLDAVPGYTATATLLIDDRRPDVFRQLPTLADAQTLNALVESEVEVLRSVGLARSVADTLQLADDPEFRRPPGWRLRLTSALRAMLLPFHDDGSVDTNAARERLAQQLLGMTVVRRVGLTYVIEVDVTATTPDEAARLARGVTTAYLAEQLAAHGGSTREAADWLQQRLDTLRLQALKADAAVQAFEAQSGIVQTGQGQLDQQQLAELDSQLIAARSRTAQAKARLDAVTAVLAKPGIAEDAVPEVLQSPVITSLRQKYFEDARVEAEWSSRYGRSHAAAVNLRHDMAQLEDSIRREVGRIAEAARNEEAVAEASDVAIKAQLDALVGQSTNANASRATLKSLQSSAEVYRALYSSFLQHYAQTAQEESFPVATARVLTAAMPPLTRSRPRTGLVLAGAAVLGLVMGFGLALARELLDRGLRTSEQVERELGLACPALLPEFRVPRRYRRGRLASSRWLPAIRLGPDTSQFAREVWRLRLRTLQHLGDGRSGVVVVAPIRSGDGASTVADCLAAAFDAAGHRTALVRLAAAGAAAQLTDGSAARAENSGSMVPICVQSRSSSDLRHLLNELRLTHELVVLDVPALDRIDAAEVALRAADCLVLVARYGLTSARDVATLIDGYGLDWRRVSGLVLNRANREIGSRTRP